MYPITVDSIYNEIMLLTAANRYELYDRIKKEFHYENEIIAFTTAGKPLTRNEYIEQINVGLKQIKNGEVITDDELQREIETW
jgi:hypothetical protein